MNPEHGSKPKGGAAKKGGTVKKAVTKATSYLPWFRDIKKGVNYEYSIPTDEEWVDMKETLTQAAFEAEVELAAKEAAIQFPAYLDMVERKIAAWKVNYSSGAAATAGVPSAEITMESSDTQSTPLGQASGGQNPDGIFSRGAPG